MVCQGQPLIFGDYPYALRERNNKIVGGKKGNNLMIISLMLFGTHLKCMDALVIIGLLKGIYLCEEVE